ncbi:tRNA(Met) cytidine acetate ligase [Amedibacillus sp. YH-ame6]
MHICGIICEYNPFHNGHLYHIQKAREITKCDLLICVMSGNFVQRGEAAISDKWTRAEVAIQHGCDLVVELPFPFVTQRADRFAHGALEVLKQAGVDSIVFGSECGDVDRLYEAARMNLNMKSYQENGISYAKALENALHFPLSSNDMLGVFYIKKILNTTIKAYCIKRTNQYHDTEIIQSISSATAIRKAHHENLDITHTTNMKPEMLTGFKMDSYYPYLQTYLSTVDKEYLSSLFLVDEGIESLLIKQAKQLIDFESFLNACTSKRYTKASIQRTCIHILTQTTKKEIDALKEPDYLRVLAYNTKGQAHLRKLQDEDVVVASTFKNIPNGYRELELRSTMAYAYPYDLKKRQEIIKRELLPAVCVK